MATTRLIPMHIGKGKTIAVSLKDRTDYVENPDRTRGCELITAYECDPAIVNVQFLLLKSNTSPLPVWNNPGKMMCWPIRYGTL